MNDQKLTIVKALDIVAYSLLVLLAIFAVFIKTTNDINLHLGLLGTYLVIALAVSVYLARCYLKRIIYFFGYAYAYKDNFFFYYVIFICVFLTNVFLYYGALKNYHLYINL